MHVKIIPLVVGTICISGLSIVTLAQNGFGSTQSHNPTGFAATNGQFNSGTTSSIGANGYVSSGSSGGAGANGYVSTGSNGSHETNGYTSTGHHEPIVRQHHWPKHPVVHTYFGPPHIRSHFNKLFWINSHSGAPLPAQAVPGGYERGHALFICRSNFKGGVHPGKIVDNTCHISWGGNEIALSQYQVLVSSKPLAWIAASYGNVPQHAIYGGNEFGRPLYICQANYNGGVHPGKIVGQVCDIAWGGREISLSQYRVLSVI